MTSEIIAAITGAAIALVGGIVGAILQHVLYLRAEKKKMGWEEEKAKARELRGNLMATNLSPAVSAILRGAKQDIVALEGGSVRDVTQTPGEPMEAEAAISKGNVEIVPAAKQDESAD
jgi:hypothetical protein